MGDLFLNRMQLKGSSIGKAMKRNSDMIMNSSFTNDPHTKDVRVYYPLHQLDIETEAKYQKITKFSILKDQIEYHLQFRPMEHYPVGSYVDIPNDAEQIETWIIVGRDDNPQFVKYSVLKCNWTLKWVVNNVIYSALGILRNRNSYNSGVWTDSFTTSIENQNSFWVPTNPITQTLYYDQRLIISDNHINPLVYSVTKIEDIFPQGITRIILKQDMYNPNRDNKELMIADFYNDGISAEEPVENSNDNYAIIDISSWKDAKIVIGSDYSILFGRLYEDLMEQNVSGVWTYDIPAEIFDKFDIIEDSVHNALSIKCAKDYSLVGTIITFTFSSNDNTYSTAQKIEVVAR